MSYYEEEDFYNEPSEFEMQIDEFKQSLLKNVKDEFTTEMERLRKENAELQVVKKNFEQIERDYKNKEWQLEIERSDLMRTVRKERLSVLMKDFEVITYSANTDRVLSPKCDKCTANRRILYKTPSGKDAYEDCECSVRKLVYVPKENICSSFSVDRDGNKIDVWYKFELSDSEEYSSLSSSTYSKKIYSNDLKYEDIKRYETFFKDKEECQKYCDWLTEKEESTHAI